MVFESVQVCVIMPICWFFFLILPSPLLRQCVLLIINDHYVLRQKKSDDGDTRTNPYRFYSSRIDDGTSTKVVHLFAVVSGSDGPKQGKSLWDWTL